MRRAAGIAGIICSMLGTLLSLYLATIPLPAKPAGSVTDNAGVLPADRVATLDAKLKSFEQQTSDQILVYVDKKVPAGTTVEEMGPQAMREWGVGQKQKNNGAILFLFTEDRKMRIEVGYGLEGSLTDARSRLITSELMKPRLKSGDYVGAIDAATNAMMNFAKGEDYKGNGKTVAEANAGSSDVGAGVLVGLFIFALFGITIVFIIIQTIRKKLVWSTSSGATSSSSDWSSSSSDSSSSSSWSSSDSSSDSSSSSDFSGGGGDSGGGGSSDSW